MRKITTEAFVSPADTLAPKVVEFRSHFGEISPLDELVRSGAQRMLQTAMEAEVQESQVDKISRGWHRETGRRWCERIWILLATCAQQGRSAFGFFHHSIVAHFKSQASPSLLPKPP